MKNIKLLAYLLVFLLFLAICINASNVDQDEEYPTLRSMRRSMSDKWLARLFQKRCVGFGGGCNSGSDCCTGVCGSSPFDGNTCAAGK